MFAVQSLDVVTSRKLPMYYMSSMGFNFTARTLSAILSVFASWSVRSGRFYCNTQSIQPTSGTETGRGLIANMHELPNGQLNAPDHEQYRKSPIINTLASTHLHVITVVQLSPSCPQYLRH